MKVFLQSIIAQLLLTAYICWRGYGALPNRTWVKRTYLSIFAAELALFFFGYFFNEHMSDNMFVSLMMICNTWYISALYITMMLLPLEIFRLKKQAKQLIYPLIIFATIGIMIMAHRNVTQPKVIYQTAHIPKKSPSGSDSMRIAFISDLHIGEVITRPYVKHIVDLINEQEPDIVLLGGDILDYESRFAENQRTEEELLRLEAPLGVYGVMGNHEYRANRHAKQRWFEKAGITMLVDSVVMIDNSFYLIGRDDFINKKRKALQELVKDLDNNTPRILIDHQPWSFAEGAMNQIDFSLHGHTHNGQLWPYPLLMKLVYECPYGSFQKGITTGYVSCGVGCAGPPYRVGTRSEIIIIDLRFD